MSDTIGLRDLRQNLKAAIDRVRHGERVIVTDHNKPIAQLVPHAEPDLTYVQPGSDLEALVKEGLVIPARGPLRIDPIRLEDTGITMQEALDETRADRDI